MKSLFQAILTLALGTLAVHPLPGQVASPNAIADQVPFFAAALTELISDSRAFTARADLWIQGGTASETVQLPFAVAMNNGAMRWQADLGKLRGQDVDTEAVGSLKQLGLDHFALILRPQTNAIISFPLAKSYVEMPLNQVEPLREKAQAKVGFLQKTLVGKETVNGHPCLKYKLTVNDGSKHFDEAFVWKATDLKDLPIRMVIRSGGKVYTLQFSNISAQVPDPKLFALPVDHTRYAGFESFISATVLKGLTSNDKSNPLSLNSLLESLR